MDCLPARVQADVVMRMVEVRLRAIAEGKEPLPKGWEICEDDGQLRWRTTTDLPPQERRREDAAEVWTSFFVEAPRGVKVEKPGYPWVPFSPLPSGDFRSGDCLTGEGVDSPTAVRTCRSFAGDRCAGSHLIPEPIGHRTGHKKLGLTPKTGTHK